MDKIVISGYYGFQNTGDEAVLCALVETLRAAAPKMDITVLSNAPEETSAALSVKAVDRWKLFTVIRTLKESGLLISGGGSLLQDVTGRKSILYYLGVMWLARLCGCKVMVCGQGIGPVNGKFHRWLVQRILNRADRILVRDEQSAAELAAMGVRREISVTADPVLGWKREKAKEPYLRPAGRNVLLCLRPWPHLDKEVLARVADYLLSTEWNVYFLPFHEPVDAELSRQIMEQMQGEALLIGEGMSPSEKMTLVGEADLVLGMRLHSLVMAAAGAVPFVAISYDPKVDAFCARTGQPVVGRAEALSAADICYGIEEAWRRRGSSHDKLQKQAAGWHQQNRELAAEAIALLRKKKER